jgi:hypothetical protein
MKSPETYRRYARDINAFATALNRFLEVMEPHRDALLPNEPRFWTPRAGQESDAARLKANVDLLTGRAAHAFAAAGSQIDWKPRAAYEWQTIPVNPAAGWQTILDSDPRFDVSVIFTCGLQAIGILDMRAEEAEEWQRQRFRRAIGRAARLTGSGLRPLARWTLRTAGTLAAAGLTFWLGWS